MGGIALGNGVVSSGLLEVMDDIISKLIQGVPMYAVVLILSPIVLVSEILIECPCPHIFKFCVPLRLSPLSSVIQ